MRTQSVIGQFRKDDRGAIALMFALMLPVLFGIVGLGLETGIWFKERRELQAVVDAAAVSAAIENDYGATATEVKKAALLEATKNGFDSSTDTLQYIGVPTTGVVAGNTAYIEVVVTRKLETILSQVLFTLNPQTTARAVAFMGDGTSDACVLALNDNAQKALEFSGNSNVDVNGCVVASNSSHDSAIEISGSSTVTAESLYSTGGYSVFGAALLNTTSNPKQYVRPTNDPYADLTIPAYSGCDQTEYKVSPSQTETITPISSVTPYVFCKGLDIKGTLNLSPGIYIVDQGTFNLNASADVSGSNVTIMMTSSTGSNYAKFDMNGGASLNLTAPSTGDYAGMLLYGDRNGPMQVNRLNGNASAVFNGAIYLPSGDLTFSGSSALGTAACTQLIANLVEISGSTDITTSGCEALGGKLAYVGGAVKLAQ